MSLNTHSKFYFGFEVNPENNYLDFDEGSGELSAVIDVGSFTLEQFAAKIQTAMREAGTLEYVVSVNRSTRKLTISAGANFDLLLTTGTHAGTSIFQTAGFNGADLTGASSYLADAAIGSVYVTQFILQSYVSPEDSRGSTYGTVNKSASGQIEVVTFGTESFTKFDIKWVSNRDNGSGGPVRYNATGVADLRTFMQYLTTKAPLEFMEDENDPDTFVSMFLESTPEDQMGMRYELKEQYGRGLPGYFETGVLKFRMLD